MLPYNWKPRSQRRLSTVYGLPPCYSFVYMLSMTSALEKAKKTRCGVFLEVVTTSTLINQLKIFLIIHLIFVYFSIFLFVIYNIDNIDRRKCSLYAFIFLRYKINYHTTSEIIIEARFNSVRFRIFRLNYLMSGLTPSWYHATNIALHAIACVLVTRVSLAVASLRPGFATLTGLLFAAHPVHTEAVSNSFK